MIERMQVYKCAICGNMVEVLHPGGGSLVCCGQPMTALVENTVDASREKHVPVITRTANGAKVAVGSVPHPMEEKHFIHWIEVLAEGRVHRQFLTPGARPEAFFDVTAAKLSAREYCNLHGLWRADA